jgi:hypothetical protein
MRASVTVSGTGNTPPTVSITGPSDGATFPAPASFVIQAVAADTDGIITQVEFFSGTSSLGVVTAPPYSLLVTNLPAGSYTFTAKATDNLGTTSGSSVVSISVNSLTSPSLSSAVIAENGEFSFVVQGASTATLNVVQESDDLVAWTSVTTNRPSTAVWTFIDTSSTNAGARYYRVLVQPGQ